MILGMARRGECESLQKRGLSLGILRDTNNAQRLADVSEFVVVEPFDFSRPLTELVGAVSEIKKRFGIACLFNVNEQYVAQTAAVAVALGLPGITPESAQLCLDKTIMRQRFQERIRPGASARFQVVQSESELLSRAQELGYPCFLQPSNVSASMWATRNASPEILLENYRTMLDEVPKHYQRIGKKNAQLTVVLAEFLAGRNISIDCLVDQAGRVYTTPPVDMLTGRDVGLDDFHHFARIVPANLSASEQHELEQLAVAGVQALDMTTCAAHVEFIGSRLGEIAARPGGNRARIMELAYGIDELHAYYQVLCGQTPDLRPDRNLAVAVVSPFASHKGTLRSIRHLESLTKLPGYLYHEVRANPGQTVGLAKNGFRAPLYIELLSPDADAIRRSVDQIAAWTDLYEVE